MCKETWPQAKPKTSTSNTAHLKKKSWKDLAKSGKAMNKNGSSGNAMKKKIFTEPLSSHLKRQPGEPGKWHDRAHGSLQTKQINSQGPLLLRHQLAHLQQHERNSQHMATSVTTPTTKVSTIPRSKPRCKGDVKRNEKVHVLPLVRSLTSTLTSKQRTFKKHRNAVNDSGISHRNKKSFGEFAKRSN